MLGGSRELLDCFCHFRRFYTNSSGCQSTVYFMILGHFMFSSQCETPKNIHSSKLPVKPIHLPSCAWDYFLFNSNALSDILIPTNY